MMKKALMTAISAALFLFVGAANTIADEHEGDDLKFNPIEAYTCKYREGKGPADLKAVNDEWNAWMDEQGSNDYFAITMTAQYHSDYGSADVYWIGGWRDGNAMGTGMDSWMTDGRDVGAKYGEVVNCSSGAAYIGTTLRAPKDDGDESDSNFVVSFSNCSLKDDSEDAWDNFMDAQKAWNAYADENGIDGSAYLWFPMAGEDPDAEEYGFKYIVAWDDHTMRGASWQKFADGHWRKNDELFAGLLDCDSSRIYNAEVVREMGDEE